MPSLHGAIMSAKLPFWAAWRGVLRPPGAPQPMQLRRSACLLHFGLSFAVYTSEHGITKVFAMIAKVFSNAKLGVPKTLGEGITRKLWDKDVCTLMSFT